MACAQFQGKYGENQDKLKSDPANLSPRTQHSLFFFNKVSFKAISVFHQRDFQCFPNGFT